MQGLLPFLTKVWAVLRLPGTSCHFTGPFPAKKSVKATYLALAHCRTMNVKVKVWPQRSLPSNVKRGIRSAFTDLVLDEGVKSLRRTIRICLHSDSGLSCSFLFIIKIWYLVCALTPRQQVTSCCCIMPLFDAVWMKESVSQARVLQDEIILWNALQLRFKDSTTLQQSFYHDKYAMPVPQRWGTSKWYMEWTTCDWGHIEKS